MDTQELTPQARYLRLIFDLLEAGASTVVYEAASSLTALTNNPVAVKAAASNFIELRIKEADNNVKLIVLDRVDQLRDLLGCRDADVGQGPHQRLRQVEVGKTGGGGVSAHRRACIGAGGAAVLAGPFYG